MSEDATPRQQPMQKGQTAGDLEAELWDKYKRLHAMAAHCHSYQSELETIAAVIVALMVKHEEISGQLGTKADETEHVRRALEQQLDETNAVAMAHKVAKRRIKYLLALVSIDPCLSTSSQQRTNSEITGIQFGQNRT